jgi:predicted glycoside hydrolase/deacetylase ChbG (UPF0249 family)
MIRLITNADDFGLTDSITDAIIDTHINGIMTSTTMMSNMEGFDYAVSKAKEHSSLVIGIHFNLTEGTPITDISKIPDLVNGKGLFKCNEEQRKNLLFGKHKLKQIQLELQNQLEKLLDNGISPSHFDSHHHITGVPLAFQASVKVSKEFNINTARVTNIDFRYAFDYKGGYVKKVQNQALSLPKSVMHLFNKKQLQRSGFLVPDTKILPTRVLPFENDSINQFTRTLSVLKSGVTEISFHPGYKNSCPADSNKTAALRLRDLEVANSEKVKQYIMENNIQLISFKDL